jgi:hypothetical protein
MSRNTIMTVVGVLSAAILVGTALGAYRIVSYLAAGLIVMVMFSAVAERAERELDPAPYTGLLVGLLVTFVVGMTGIWLFWSPGQTSYVYLFGLPRSTLAYVVFIWILPLFGAIYYAILFPAIGSDEIVAEIMERARSAQDSEQYPMTPERTESTVTTDGGDQS